MKHVVLTWIRKRNSKKEHNDLEQKRGYVELSNNSDSIDQQIMRIVPIKKNNAQRKIQNGDEPNIYNIKEKIDELKTNEKNPHYFITSENATEFICEVVKADKIELLEELLINEKFIDSLDFENQQPILEAIRNENLDMMRLLIHAGYNVNSRKSDKGRTLLHSVVSEIYKKQKEIIELLLEEGANPTIKDIDSKTVLDVFSADPKLKKIIEEKSIIVIRQKNLPVKNEITQKELKKISDIIKIETYKSTLREMRYEGINDVDYEKEFDEQTTKNKLRILAYAIRVINKKPNRLGVRYTLTEPAVTPDQVYHSKMADCDGFIVLYAYLAEHIVGIKPQDFTIIDIRNKFLDKKTKKEEKIGHTQGMIRIENEYYLIDMTMGKNYTFRQVEKKPTIQELANENLRISGYRKEKIVPIWEEIKTYDGYKNYLLSKNNDQIIST